MVNILIKLQADLFLEDSQGNNVLFYACKGKGHAAKNIVKILLERGLSINKQNQLGEIPLMKTLLKKDVGISQLLIQQGSDLYLWNSKRESSLEMIFAWNKKEVVDLVKKILRIKNPGKIEEFGEEKIRQLQSKFLNRQKTYSKDSIEEIEKNQHHYFTNLPPSPSIASLGNHQEDVEFLSKSELKMRIKKLIQRIKFAREGKVHKK